jgi:hypothetical protein
MNFHLEPSVHQFINRPGEEADVEKKMADFWIAVHCHFI